MTCDRTKFPIENDDCFVSPLQILNTPAGYYIGRTCWDKKNNYEGPFSRESGYFRTHDEAKKAMHNGWELRQCIENDWAYESGAIPKPPIIGEEDSDQGEEEEVMIQNYEYPKKTSNGNDNLAWFSYDHPFGIGISAKASVRVVGTLHGDPPPRRRDPAQQHGERNPAREAPARVRDAGAGDPAIAHLHRYVDAGAYMNWDKVKERIHTIAGESTQPRIDRNSMPRHWA